MCLKSSRLEAES